MSKPPTLTRVMRTALILGTFLGAILFFILFGGRHGNFQKTFLVAHNMSPSHPVHRALEYMASELQIRSKNRLGLKIYSSAQLGAEREVIELLQAGVISMTKVSAMSMESFVPVYGVLNLPFLFRGKQHAFNVLDGAIGEELLLYPTGRKIIGLTFFDAGARSFYSTKKLETPKDITGLKTRVMRSQTAIQMVDLLGGSATPMPFGEIYTALQQSVIDAAENNEISYVINRHHEVAKNFVRDEHMISPDVLIMSHEVWKSLKPKDKKLLKEVSELARDYQRKLWQKKTDEALETMRAEGVKIISPNKSLFRDKVLSLHEAMAQKDYFYRNLIERIKSIKE